MKVSAGMDRYVTKDTWLELSWQEMAKMSIVSKLTDKNWRESSAEVPDLLFSKERCKNIKLLVQLSSTKRDKCKIVQM